MMRVEEKCINPEWGFYMSDVVFIQEERRSVYHRQIFMFTSIFISFWEVVSSRLESYGCSKYKWFQPYFIFSILKIVVKVGMYCMWLCTTIYWTNSKNKFHNSFFSWIEWYKCMMISTRKSRLYIWGFFLLYSNLNNNSLIHFYLH